MAIFFLRVFGGLLTWLCVCGEYYVGKESPPSVKYQPVPETDDQYNDYSITEVPLPGSSTGNASTPFGNCANCTAPSQCVFALIPTCIARAPTICATGACSTTETSTATSTKIMTTTSTDVAISTNIITHTTTHPVTHTSTALATVTSTTTATDTSTATETKTKTLTTVDTKTATSTHVTTATSTAVATSTATVNSTHTTTSTSTLNTTHIQVIPTTKTLYTTKTLTATSFGIVNKTVLTTATEIATSTSTHTTTEVETQTKTATETLKTTATHLTTDTITATSTHVTTATSTAVQTETNTHNVTNTKTETSTQIHHTTATEIHSKTLTETETSTQIATSVVTSCSINCPMTTILPTTTVHTTKVVTSTVFPTRPTTPPPPACKEALDIGVLVDASDSVNPEDFRICLQFVSNLTDKFQVSSESTHFGAILFSSTPEMKFNFADSRYYKPSTLKAEIMTFERIATGTRIDLALKLADTDLFSVPGGDRDSKPNILIVITDGRTDPARSSPYSVVLKPLQDKQVKTVVVGVGKDVLQDELVEIAMGKKENVFMVNDYENLIGFMEKILQSSCAKAPTTPTPGPTQPPEGTPTTPTPGPTIPPEGTPTTPTPGPTQPPEGTPTTPTPGTTQPPEGSQCNVKYTKLGCFKDKSNSRALTQLIHNERGSIDWKAWDTWLPGFICRCAEKTKEKNFFYFGAQFYGECWSDPTGGETYNMHGPSDTCVDKQSGTCTAATVGECVGEKNTNYVYQVVVEANPEDAIVVPSPTSAVEYEKCHVDFHKIGCYNDDMKNPRPLEELLFTDRDNTSALYSGIPIDWGNWDFYISDLVCRCAETAQGKKYDTFGIENFGECWSGGDAGNTYSRAGQSDLCMTTEYATCDPINNKDCVGNATTLFVYGINKEEVIPCGIQFENVGCYKDNDAGSRPLPELVFTDVDTDHEEYTGFSVQWGQLDRYLADVACRCAENSAEMGYEYFGIQNYGQCYSGKSASQTYKNDGVSDQCVHEDYQPCPSNAVEETCVGKEKANYVYRVIGSSYVDKIKNEKHYRRGKMYRDPNRSKGQ